MLTFWQGQKERNPDKDEKHPNSDINTQIRNEICKSVSKREERRDNV